MVGSRPRRLRRAPLDLGLGIPFAPAHARPCARSSCVSPRGDAGQRLERGLDDRARVGASRANDESLAAAGDGPGPRGDHHRNGRALDRTGPGCRAGLRGHPRRYVVPRPERRRTGRLDELDPRLARRDRSMARRPRKARPLPDGLGVVGPGRGRRRLHPGFDDPRGPGGACPWRCAASQLLGAAVARNGRSDPLELPARDSWRALLASAAHLALALAVLALGPRDPDPVLRDRPRAGSPAPARRITAAAAAGRGKMQPHRTAPDPARPCRRSAASVRPHGEDVAEASPRTAPPLGARQSDVLAQHHPARTRRMVLDPTHPALARRPAGRRCDQRRPTDRAGSGPASPLPWTRADPKRRREGFDRARPRVWVRPRSASRDDWCSPTRMATTAWH